ncbi:hypothetical protein A5662_02870 [Mycobacteriaceae bacterium 1482268.1]|nr:hypothetical protein A5662_02870 [Mycobacteriaceae bacterium 1482268.1]
MPSGRLWITSRLRAAAGQLEAAAAAVDELELLADEVEELELELSDLPDSDFVSELDEVDDSALFDEPFDELLAASRLSVR